MADALKNEVTSSRLFGIGRRKSAVAQVRLTDRVGERTVNGEAMPNYFSTVDMQKLVESPLELTSTNESYGFVIKVKGGGKHAQADAVRHGLARALIKVNPAWRTQLKTSGMLTRDARVKERKKYGLKRARRAPQFSKR